MAVFPPDISAEFRILLEASGVGPVEPRAQAIARLIDRGLDWMRLRDAARLHGVVPVLVDALPPHAADAMPPDARTWIDRHRRRAVKRTLLLTAHLTRIFDRLERDGIQALSFKGPTLASVAYGDLRLRESSDLDVLVRREDVQAGAFALEALGFRPRFALSAHNARAVLDAENALAFDHDADRSVVELHWALMPKYMAFRDEPEEVWADLMLARPGGRPIPTLAPERLLRFLCVHAAKHYCERLVWVSDIAHLVSCGVPIKWTRLAADAERGGSRRMLWLGLRLARDLLHAPIPPAVSADLDADRQVRWLAAEAARTLTGTPSQGHVRRVRFHLAIRDRLRDRVHYGVHAALTPTVRDFETLRLPRALTRLYGPLRPFRLLRDYTGHGRQS